MQALTSALRDGDSRSLLAATRQLQACLPPALHGMRSWAAADRAGPQRVHARVSNAAAALAAQREAVARACATAERAAAILFPRNADAYDARGVGARPLSKGSLVA